MAATRAYESRHDGVARGIAQQLKAKQSRDHIARRCHCGNAAEAPSKLTVELDRFADDNEADAGSDQRRSMYHVPPMTRAPPGMTNKGGRSRKTIAANSVARTGIMSCVVVVTIAGRV
jgi:hypothetical protein